MKLFSNVKRSLFGAGKAASAKTYRFVDGKGKEHAIEIAVPKPIADAGATFVFGIYKGGSTLLNRMVADILKESGRRPLELPGHLFKQGIVIDQIAKDVDGIFEVPGVVYTGFRSIPQVVAKSANFLAAKKIVMVRDPRDILVSLYFSHAYSHTLPSGGEARKLMEERRKSALETDIDQYALEQAPNVLVHLMRMSEVAGSGMTTLVRYEDVIFDKPQMADIICRTIGVEISPEAKAAIVEKNDIRPQQEDKFAHIRNVAPGDHLQKLKPETIAELDKTLAKALTRFYPDGVPHPTGGTTA
ncbi:MAG: sulfotransferase domain-containing protein [Hyphomicrobiaceae bacterium]|nr:sulfotransferase domain-containing protein [Hyphomicrobiaceae bacterium]